MAQKQSVRIQLADGGEVEVASVQDAEQRYPDATILWITTWEKDGVATTEPYREYQARQRAEQRERAAAKERRDAERAVTAAPRQAPRGDGEGDRAT